ncbi:hypothetical protein DENSPDRAFT_390503 [Dentipellis sp. KUC8613]|nr:hypothetical protein DENSPDRAFT_390503 [Dentipellis sp. KUC8613]
MYPHPFLNPYHHLPFWENSCINHPTIPSNQDTPLGRSFPSSTPSWPGFTQNRSISPLHNHVYQPPSSFRAHLISLSGHPITVRSAIGAHCDLSRTLQDSRCSPSTHPRRLICRSPPSTTPSDVTPTADLPLSDSIPFASTMLPSSNPQQPL